MDLETAALLGACLLAGLIMGLRALNVWATHNEEQLAIKRANAERMAQLDAKNPKKNGKSSKKKRKDEEEDDDEEGDDLDVLIEAARPFGGFLQGLAQSRKLPINVEALLDHDPREKAKVEMWLEAQSRKGGPPGAAAESEYL